MGGCTSKPSDSARSPAKVAAEGSDKADGRVNGDDLAAKNGGSLIKVAPAPQQSPPADKVETSPGKAEPKIVILEEAEAPRQDEPKKQVPSLEVSHEAQCEAHLNVNRARLRETRTVRVFISSTFRDFALERDYLMRHALPQVRKFGESRGVAVVFVDLRWGVTTEESSSGAVVKLCLQEIDSCRPFFIGMLGERYGWHISPDYKDELLERTMELGKQQYPWVEDYFDRSVTELEILHGALLQPSKSAHASFYFREHEKYLNRMGDQISAQDRQAYEPESQFAKKGQNALKSKIQECFPERVTEYSHVKEMSAKVVEDLSTAIEAAFPVDLESFDVWEGAQLQHEAFAASQRMGYFPNPSSFEELKRCLSQNKSVAIVGPSGYGKSALIANWASSLLSDNRSSESNLVFQHYIGSSAQSTDHFHLIRRAMVFFSKYLDISILDFCAPEDVAAAKARERLNRERGHEAATRAPTAAEEAMQMLPENRLVEAFSDFMVSVGSRANKVGKRIIIILDALDQLESKGNAHSLFWLPESKGIIYFVTIKSDPNSVESPRKNRDSFVTSESGIRTTLQRWRDRDLGVMSISRLEDHEQREIIKRYLSEHAKKLDEEQTNKVLAAEQANNPLYLRALLDEARLFGDFFRLGAHLDSLLAAATSVDLYGLILSRMAEECGAQVTWWTAGFVLCARDGITDLEVREALGRLRDGAPKTKAGPVLEPDYVLKGDAEIRLLAQLLFGFREQLCSTSGLLAFNHDAASRAVAKQLTGIDQVESTTDLDETLKLIHSRMADFFQASVTSSSLEGANTQELQSRRARQMRELPHHLSLANEPDSLADFLSQIHVLEHMLSEESTKYELVKYWRDVEKFWKADPAHSTENRSTHDGAPAESPVETYLVGVVNNAKQGIDLPAVTHDEGTREKALLASRIMDAVSSLLVLLSMYDGAVSARQDEIAYNTVLFGKEHDKVSVSCSELADIYERVYSKYDVSMKLKTRAIEIDRKLFGSEAPQLAVGYDNLANLHLKLGDYAQAESIYQKSLTIKEKALGPSHRDVAQTACSLGLLHEELNHWKQAEKWYLRALDIRTKHFGPAHPSVARSQIDLGMLRLGSCKDITEIRANVLPRVENGVASLEAALGRSHTDVAAAANNLGLVHAKLNSLDRALKCHKTAKGIQLLRLGSEHPAFATTCNNIASVCQELAEKAFRDREEKAEQDYFASAEEHNSRAVLIYRVKLGESHHELATALNNLGTLYYDAALRDITRAVDSCEDLRISPEDAECAKAVQDISRRVKDMLEAAHENIDEAFTIRTRIFGADHPSVLAAEEARHVCKSDLDLMVRESLSGLVRAKQAERCEAADALLGPDFADSQDALQVCAKDVTRIEAIVQRAFVEKFGAHDITTTLTSSDFNTIVDKVTLDLSIEVPTPEDLAAAISALGIKSTDEAGAKQIAQILHRFINDVYFPSAK